MIDTKDSADCLPPLPSAKGSQEDTADAQGPLLPNLPTYNQSINGSQRPVSAKTPKFPQPLLPLHIEQKRPKESNQRSLNEIHELIPLSTNAMPYKKEENINIQSQQLKVLLIYNIYLSLKIPFFRLILMVNPLILDKIATIGIQGHRHHRQLRFTNLKFQ